MGKSCDRTTKGAGAWGRVAGVCQRVREISRKKEGRRWRSIEREAAGERKKGRKGEREEGEKEGSGRKRKKESVRLRRMRLCVALAPLYQFLADSCQGTTLRPTFCFPPPSHAAVIFTMDSA